MKVVYLESIRETNSQHPTTNKTNIWNWFIHTFVDQCKPNQLVVVFIF
jgi:hypothetical protein